MRKIINLGLGVAVLGLSIGFALWLVYTRPVPDERNTGPLMPKVAVLTVDARRFEAPVVGYGTVRPKSQVNIIPEVSGRLVQVHSNLRTGNIIPKGELLFEVDPRLYVSRVRQAESDVSRLETQLARHHKDEGTLQEQVKLAKEREDLSRQRLERERGLLKSDSTTEPEVEAAQQALLAQQEIVLDFQSRLAAIPLLVQETTAMLEAKRAQLEEAKLSLEKTRIYCPFDARVDQVKAQESQTVTASLQIATLTDMEAFEVSVVIDPRELRWTDQERFADASTGDVDMAPEARITCTVLGRAFSWTGRVTRLERVDETTRTAHVVVEISDLRGQREGAATTDRPILSIGMFCQAQIPVRPLDDALVVPRDAIRDGRFVYVFEPDAADTTVGVLAIKRVPMLRTAGDEVLVSFGPGKQANGFDTISDGDTSRCELDPGDQVILSALPKAIAGMPLRLHDGGLAGMADGRGAGCLVLRTARRFGMSLSGPAGLAAGPLTGAP